MDLIPQTFHCYTCGAASTPENRIPFATEYECMDCLHKRCQAKQRIFTVKQVEAVWKASCLDNKCMPAYWYTNQEALMQFADLIISMKDDGDG